MVKILVVIIVILAVACLYFYSKANRRQKDVVEQLKDAATDVGLHAVAKGAAASTDIIDGAVDAVSDGIKKIFKK